jgi:hypothetical protein
VAKHRIRLNHPGGSGSTTFEVSSEGHEVWMAHPVRTPYGSMAWLNRFQPDEALRIAAALVDAAGSARAAGPEDL